MSKYLDEDVAAHVRGHDIPLFKRLIAQAKSFRLWNAVGRRQGREITDEHLAGLEAKLAELEVIGGNRPE
jgi:hypothetical protein